MTLELIEVRKAFDGFELGPVDLNIDNEVLAILGPSGSGKTTLLRLIAGISSLSGGAIRLGGRTLDSLSPEDRNMGMVFQDGALFPHMTVRQNIAYAAAAPDRVLALAERLEVTALLDRKPKTLSGGEYRRVALARTLATEPSALLLDEPLSSLDRPIQTRLLEMLHLLFDELDIPVLYVTHDQRTAMALGNRIVIINDGVIEQIGSPTAIISRPRNRFIAHFTSNENCFDAHVADWTDAGAVLQIGEVRLGTTAQQLQQTQVTACMHPSRIAISAPGAPTAERVNALSGRLIRHLFQGNEYRVHIDIDAAPLTFAVTVHPIVFDRLSLENRSAVQVLIPFESIHVISDRPA
jgi:molybdate/tungstate transport system ATP-binding protein